METEMQQLKRNTEIQKAKETRDEIVEYIRALDAEIIDRLRWHERARNLELTVLLTHFGVIFALAFSDVSYAQYSWIPDLSFIVFIVVALRSSVIHTQAIGAMREQAGVIKTLQIIGMIPKDEDPRTKRKVKVKRWSPFARYKEFWERITEKKTQETYA